MKLGLFKALYHAHHAILHVRKLSLHVFTVIIGLEDLIPEGLSALSHLLHFSLFLLFSHFDKVLELVDIGVKLPIIIL